MISNPRFFIIGYFGWFNAGDDAIGLSIIRELNNMCPNASFTITCNDQYYLDNFKETNLTPDLKIIGFKALNILKEIAKCDHFIIAGGTHFHDEGGLIFSRINILLGFVMMSSFAKLVKKSPILLGHGIGPLSFKLSRFLVRFILTNSKMIFVRDKNSVDVVTSLGFGSKCVQGFDCTALLIGACSVQKKDSLQQSGRKIIGISLLPVYSIYSDEIGKDVEVVKLFTKYIQLLIQNDCSINIHLFAFRTGTRHSDFSLLQDISDGINTHEDAIKIIKYSGDVALFLDSIKECDFFIGMRYHASAFAYLFQKPQLILDYMGKCNSLGKDIAIDETAIIPIADIWNPRFYCKIQSLISNPEQFIANLPVNSAKDRATNMFEMLRDIL